MGRIHARAGQLTPLPAGPAPDPGSGTESPRSRAAVMSGSSARSAIVRARLRTSGREANAGTTPGLDPELSLHDDRNISDGYGSSWFPGGEECQVPAVRALDPSGEGFG